MGRLAFWLLFAATVGLYFAMMLWSLPRIAEEAGGLPAFDLRPTGYSFEDARAFLAALTPQGNVFYRNTQHLLDLIFPGLLAALLYWAIAVLLPTRLGGWRWVLPLPVLVIALFDWAENHAVGGLLEAGAGGLTPEMAATASRWSVFKAAGSTVAYTVLLALLVWRGIVWLRRRTFA
jgi:hypothetical protein